MDPQVIAPYRLLGPRLDVRVVPLRPRARNHIKDFFRAERRGIQAAIEDLRPDLVHAHWSYEFALAAERSGIPTVVTVHDWGPSVLARHRDLYRLARLGMQVRSIAKARCLTAVSPRIKRLVERTYRKDVAFVPNGLPDEYYRSQAVVSRPSTTLTFGALVNGVDPNKNLGVLLEAFSHCRDRAQRLVLGGHGCSLGDPLHTWAAQRGWDEGVLFRGPMSPHEVPAFLEGLDVFVHPSLEESFGMAILESLAVGTPVIGGARSGAVPWLLEEGRAGLLTDVRDPRAVARAMDEMREPRTRSVYATSGRLRAEHFRMSEVATQYVAIYRELVASRSP